MRLFSEAANKKQDVDSRVYEIFQSRVVGVTSGGATTSTTETQRLQDSTQPSKQPVKKYCSVNQSLDVSCCYTIMPDRGQGFGPGPNHLGPGPHHQYGPGGAALRAIADVPTSSPTYLPSTTNEDTQEGTRTAASGTTNQVAPTIPVLNKIQPSNANATDPRPPKPKRIIVPQKSCNGGFDFKFDNDPHHVSLLDLLSPQDYTDAITTLNESIKKSRSTKLDAGLLATGPLLVPLAVWGTRHFAQTKRRKKLLVNGINHFNDSHGALYMRWNHSNSGSFLSIQPRPHNEMHEDTITVTQVPLQTGLEDFNVLV